MKDTAESVRLMALRCLVLYCNEDSKTLEIVLEVFRNDSNPDIHQTCLWEMASRWGDYLVVQ